MLENKNTATASRKKRTLILISGYYGFSNLGDEAILEVITDELKLLTAPENIIVLSSAPERTEKTFGVKAINRWNPGALLALLPRTRLFVSGGGGLFQDIASIKSPLFYGGQILSARALGTKVMVFAQGIGPLHTALGRVITRLALASCDQVAIRDQSSAQLLRSWGIESELTADPVWALREKPLPPLLAQKLEKQVHKGEQKPPVEQEHLRVGLSLRLSHNFSRAQVALLAKALDQALPARCQLVPLPLQPAQDKELLDVFCKQWRALSREVLEIDTNALERPSQWIALLKEMDLVVAMRLHCAIMSLISAVPTVAIAYDPKVAHIADQFELPTLNLAKEKNDEATVQKWATTVTGAVKNRTGLSERSAALADAARNMACQNFTLLAKILKKHT